MFFDLKLLLFLTLSALGIRLAAIRLSERLNRWQVSASRELLGFNLPYVHFPVWSSKPYAGKTYVFPINFRAWLEAHHDKFHELLVGFHRRSSEKPSITWPESVDAALGLGRRHSKEHQRNQVHDSLHFSQAHLAPGALLILNASSSSRKWV